MLTGGDEKDDQHEQNFLAHLVIWWNTKWILNGTSDRWELNA
jgi:hypothetical protein